MALFKRKEKEVEKETVEPKAEASKAVATNDKQKPVSKKGTVELGKDFSRVLKQPRITEKATFASEKGVYVFEVDKRANKHDVAKAVEQYYSVKPIKVNITNIPAKKVASRVRGRFGTKPGGKKAYVYLKEGDTIEII